VLIRLCAFSYAFVASAACLPHCVHLRIRFSWFTGDTLASACSGSVISVVLVPYRRCSVANVRAFSLQRLVGSERCLRAALRHSETSYNDVRTMRIHKAMTVMCSYCSSSGSRWDGAACLRQLVMCSYCSSSGSRWDGAACLRQIESTTDSVGRSSVPARSAAPRRSCVFLYCAGSCVGGAPVVDGGCCCTARSLFGPVLCAG